MDKHFDEAFERCKDLKKEDLIDRAKVLEIEVGLVNIEIKKQLGFLKYIVHKLDRLVS